MAPSTSAGPAAQIPGVQARRVQRLRALQTDGPAVLAELAPSFRSSCT